MSHTDSADLGAPLETDEPYGYPVRALYNPLMLLRVCIPQKDELIPCMFSVTLEG